MTAYEIGILGGPLASESNALKETIDGMISPFDLSLGKDVVLYDTKNIEDRDSHAALAIAYFGSTPYRDEGIATRLAAAGVPIVPTVGPNDAIEAVVPPSLRPLNVFRRSVADGKLVALATSLLECVGLLRRQRHLFISYRRTETRNAAIQLHDALIARGFDVFLDTHDIRPAEPFQDVLWHRLCDSDVMIMIDSPSYFESKWTRQELGRARAKEIHVLRVVWPGHAPSKLVDLSETIYLRDPEVATDGTLLDDALDKIAVAAEQLRSQSLASRYRSLTGKLRVEVERTGIVVEGIGAHRAIALRTPTGKRIWAYPAVGIPTAESLHDIAEKAAKATPTDYPVLLYDHYGIGETWLGHLKWLDSNISTVRAVRVFDAGLTLNEMES